MSPTIDTKTSKDNPDRSSTTNNQDRADRRTGFTPRSYDTRVEWTHWRFFQDTPFQDVRTPMLVEGRSEDPGTLSRLWCNSGKLWYTLTDWRAIDAAVYTAGDRSSDPERLKPPQRKAYRRRKKKKKKKIGIVTVAATRATTTKRNEKGCIYWLWVNTLHLLNWFNTKYVYSNRWLEGDTT